MNAKNVNFGDKKIKKSDFYKNKKVTKIDDIDVNKILVSKEEPYGTKNSFKYFIGYNDNDVIRPLCMKLPQMIGYVRKFEGNTAMSFKISDRKIKFDSEPVYGDNDKYIKTKIKIYSGSRNTNFQGKSVPKEKALCKCLSIIMLDSVVKAKKKHYPHTLLEECKYEPKKIKMENLIDDDLEKSSSDEYDSESDDEKDNDQSNE